jgi:3-hydroxyacyl-CoA dehydrogenase
VRCATTATCSANGSRYDREAIIGARYALNGRVAVITLDNPPVNGLGHEVRADVVAGVDQALSDAACDAVVITGAGKAFSGGADIREFNTPKASAEPTLHTVIRAVESSGKPWSRRSTARAWAGGSSSPSGATTGSRTPRRRSRCPK